MLQMPQNHSEDRVWNTGTIKKDPWAGTRAVSYPASHMLAQSHKVKAHPVQNEECLEFHWLHRQTYSTAQEEDISAAAYDTDAACTGLKTQHVCGMQAAAVRQF